MLIYSANGELGEALLDRLNAMTKEVEVGDEFTGKVVKTTTFGAFVELTKGTDGLLHISNVKPGERVDTVEDVLNRGDEIKVRVVEVDRERGRIGLRLAEDPAIAGKSAEELAGIGGGGGNGGGPRGDRGPRGGGDRAADVAATAARPRRRAALAARAAAPTAISSAAEPLSQVRFTTLDSGVRVVTEPIDSVRSAALGFCIGTGSGLETDARPACRTCWSTCSSAAPPRWPRTRSTSSSTAWAPSSTPARARRRPRSTRG